MILSKVSPYVVILLETKSTEDSILSIRMQVGLSNYLVIPSRGRYEGIQLLWRCNINQEIISYFLRHIDILMTEARRIK